MDEILLHHAALPADGNAAGAATPRGSDSGALSARLARSWSPRKRPESLLGLALLVDCARAAGRLPPGPGDVEATAGGKPRWKGGPDFSISHAGGRVACALATGQGCVGLDIEPCEAVSAENLRLVATAAELEQFAAAGLGPADLWTAKEAVIKAAGATVATIDRVAVSPVRARLDGVDYLLLRATLAPGLACTLATQTPARLSVVQVDACQVLERLG
jgi:phosphopantetheinyl transferase